MATKLGAVVSALLKIAESVRSLALASQWSAWTPTLGGGGSLTFTATTVNLARFVRVGKLVFYEISCTGTVGGTLSGYITFTLPVTAQSGANSAGGFSGYDHANTKGMHGYRDSATTFRVYHNDLTNYPSGAGGFHGSGFYEVP